MTTFLALVLFFGASQAYLTSIHQIPEVPNPEFNISFFKKAASYLEDHTLEQNRTIPAHILQKITQAGMEIENFGTRGIKYLLPQYDFGYNNFNHVTRLYELHRNGSLSTSEVRTLLERNKSANLRLKFYVDV